MENVGYASLQIIPSMKGFESKLTSGTSGPFGRAGTSGGRLFGNSAGKSITSTVTAHAKRAALASAAVFSAAGLAAFKLTKDSIAEARDAQKVGALTAAVIKSTGGAAHITAKQVGDMSTRLSNVSGVDDEVIQRGENMLLTFKGIKNYVGGQFVGTFDQATQVTLDMAAAMSGGKGGELDLKSSSILVGKALNDPVKGLSALQRVGVSFTKTQQAQIKALVEGGDANAAVATGLLDSGTAFSSLLKAQGGDINKTVALLTKDLTPAQKKVYDMYAEGGHTLEAQQRIVKELTSEFGGAAAAQATMGEKVKVAWSNIEEQLGTALLPLVDQVERAFLNKGVPALEGWAAAFQKKGVPAIRDFVHTFRRDGIPAIKDFYHQAKPVAEDVLPAIFDLIKAGRPILKTSAHLVGDLAQAFTKIPRWAQVAIAGGLLAGKAGGFKLAAGVGKSLFGGKGLLGGIASKAAPLPVFVVNEGFGGPGVGGGGGSKVPGILPWIKGIPPETIGKLPKFAPFIPVGLGGAPGHGNSLMKDLFGFGLGSDDKGKDTKLALSPGVKASIYEATHPFDGFSQNLQGAFHAVDQAIEHALPLVRRYREVLDGTPKQIKTQVELSGYEKAIGQVDTLQRKIDALAGRGLDNGVPYLHGGQPGGVHYHGDIHVTAPDERSFTRDMQRRHRRRALGGV